MAVSLRVEHHDCLQPPPPHPPHSQTAVFGVLKEILMAQWELQDSRGWSWAFELCSEERGSTV